MRNNKLNTFTFKGNEDEIWNEILATVENEFHNNHVEDVDDNTCMGDYFKHVFFDTDHYFVQWLLENNIGKIHTYDTGEEIYVLGFEETIPKHLTYTLSPKLIHRFMYPVHKLLHSKFGMGFISLYGTDNIEKMSGAKFIEYKRWMNKAPRL